MIIGVDEEGVEEVEQDDGEKDWAWGPARRQALLLFSTTTPLLAPSLLLFADVPPALPAATVRLFQWCFLPNRDHQGSHAG